MTTYWFFKTLHELGGGGAYSLGFFRGLEWNVWWKFNLV